MEFVSSEISTIKSMSQRSLALTWARAAGENSYPTLDAFRPSSRGSDPKYLVAWKVEFNPSGRTFRALYQGTHISTGCQSEWVGLTMDQVIPAGLRLPALEAANLCADTGEAIYMIYTTQDNGGNRVDAERLLLPFGPSSGGVRQLLASTEMISTNSDLRLAGAADLFNTRHEILLAARLSAARWRRESRLGAFTPGPC